jgi:hypothetical protein
MRRRVVAQSRRWHFVHLRLGIAEQNLPLHECQTATERQRDAQDPARHRRRDPDGPGRPRRSRTAALGPRPRQARPGCAEFLCPRYYQSAERRALLAGRGRPYYCKRSNGTTGLIVGAAAGALAGRAIDTQGNRGTGTILGAAAGALLGREIDRGGVRCQ